MFDLLISIIVKKLKTIDMNLRRLVATAAYKGSNTKAVGSLTL
jgi:hypothetical protein